MSQKCLLLVEDESSLRMVMMDSLSEAGFDVLEAENGDRAVEILEHCSRIDLLVTDIELPGRCDGNAVATCAKTHHLGLPVVYLSGHPESLTNAIGQRDVFISKPFRQSAMIDAVVRLLNVVEAQG